MYVACWQKIIVQVKQVFMICPSCESNNSIAVTRVLSICTITELCESLSAILTHPWH